MLASIESRSVIGDGRSPPIGREESMRDVYVCIYITYEYIYI